jgi:hypothetical protein
MASATAERGWPARIPLIDKEHHMKRILRVIGIALLVGLSLAQTPQQQRFEREQERQDQRLEHLEQQEATNTGYLNDLRDARLRERVARLESASDLIIKLLLAILGTMVSVGAYQLRVFLQIRKHLGQLHDLRTDLTILHHQLKTLACVKGECPDPNASARDLDSLPGK